MWGINSGYAQEEHPKTADSTAISPLFMPVFYAPIAPQFTAEMQYESIDTLNVMGVHYSDPQLYTENIYQSLGSFGQAHQSMIYQRENQYGFSLITLPYPLLFRQQKDLHFYKLKNVYTKLAYNFGFRQEHEFQATHAQYIRGATVAVNLHGYTNPGDYTNQNAANMIADVLVHYEIPSGWYGFRASYIFNRLTLNENGGLADYSNSPMQQQSTTKLYRVNSNYGSSKIVSNDALFQHYVNLQNRNKRYFGTILHTFQFQHLKSNYIDYLIDTNYYSYCLASMTDTLSDTLAMSLQYYNIRNSLQWSSYRPFTETPDKAYFLHVDAGVTHEFINNIYPSYKLNMVTPFARVHIRLFKAIDIYGQFSYSLMGYNSNDALMSTKIEWSLNRSKRHYLGLAASYGYVSPDFIMAKNGGFQTYSDSLRTSFGQWDSNFKKQNFLKLSAYWNYGRYSVRFNYFMEHNRVLWGSDMKPLVNSKYTSILQLHLYAPLRIKGFGFITNMYLQYASNKYVQVPLFAGKVSIFYMFSFFARKLKVQIGTDLMYNTPYFAEGYNPAFHQFYWQERYRVGNFLYFDVNLSLQVQRIAFYVRGGNLLSDLLSDRYYTTPAYPMKSISNLNITIGIAWRFYD
jgi:hypothetical protein